MLTVDLKMSWASLLPVLLAGYADGMFARSHQQINL